MDKINVKYSTLDKIVDWSLRNANGLLSSGLLTNSSPIPYKEIGILFLDSEKNSITELYVHGSSFNNFKIELAHKEIKFIISITDYRAVDDDDVEVVNKVDIFTTNNLRLDPSKESELKRIVNDEIARYALLVTSLFTYIIFHEEQVVVSKTVKKQKKQNKNKKSKGKNKVYLERTYNLLGVQKRTINENGYIRHIESWFVRGHIRRYQNGKTIFIKPYLKGKTGSPVSEKDYEL